MSHQLLADDPDATLDAIRTTIPEDAPDWTENTCWMISDPKSGVAIYAHLGRMQPDRRIWEGLSLIYLPDGTRLVNRSLGISVAAARNGEYHSQPLVPAKIWQYNFDGVAQRVDPAVLLQRALGDEPFEAASYQLKFTALQPVFNMHASTASSEHMHLDHGGRFQGIVRAGGKTYEIDCVGYRDHSVSRRTFTTLDSETWANCVFPSGRIFSMLQVSRKERQFVKGQIYVDGVMHLANPMTVPDLTSAAGAPHAGRVQLDVSGTIHDIDWRTTPDRALAFQLLRPVGMRPGVDHTIVDSLVAVQCPCEFTWDGETGYGWMERLRPLAAF